MPADEYYFVVYMPTDVFDRDHPQVEAKHWIVDTYEEAVKTVEEFISDDEFCADIECRFEIFDAKGSPVGDQSAFQDSIELAFEAQSRGDESDLGWPADTAEHPPMEDGDEEQKEEEAEEEAEAFRQEKRVFVEAINLDPPAPLPKKDEKEVKFSEIKIEERR